MANKKKKQIDKRIEYILTLMSKADKAAIEKAAADSRVSNSTFMLAAALEKIKNQ